MNNLLRLLPPLFILFSTNEHTLPPSHRPKRWLTGLHVGRLAGSRHQSCSQRCRAEPSTFNSPSPPLIEAIVTAIASNAPLLHPTQHLYRRLRCLQAERIALRCEAATLEQRATARRGPTPSGHTTQQVMAEVRALGEAVQEQVTQAVAAVAEEQARLSADLLWLKQESKRLTQRLDEALRGVQSLAAQVEVRTTALLDEAYQRQEQLLDELPPSHPAFTLAEQRQRAYQLRQRAKQEAERLQAAAQAIGEEARAAIKPLRQSSHALALTLAHLSQRAHRLPALTRLGATEPAEALFANLMTAPHTPLTVPSLPLPLPESQLPTLATGWRTLPRRRQRMIQRMVALPLLTLLLTTSLAPQEGTTPRTRPGRKSAPDQVIARITQRHLLREVRQILEGIPSPTALQRPLPPAPRPGEESGLRGGVAPEQRVTPSEPMSPPPPLPFSPATYIVQPGDSLPDIASRLALRLETLLWANPHLQGQGGAVGEGQTLLVLPTDGVLHTTVPGDTVASVAASYGVAPDALVAFPDNHLADATAALGVGQLLVVPGGRPPASQTGGTALGSFIWPTHGPLTQRAHGSHMALDISAAMGAPVLAADGGRVELAGWDTSGYGNLVAIDHGNGFRTLYAHLSAFTVEVGSMVERGSIIGAIGSTGNSTGPHLHFEIRLNGVHQNPQDYLR